MSRPQPGVFAQGTRFHHHLEFDARPRIGPRAYRTALAVLRAPAVTAGGANLVVGFGPSLWRRLARDPAEDVAAVLAAHRPARAIAGRSRAIAGRSRAIAGRSRAGTGVPGTSVPATQHDLWVWIHGSGPDVVLDVARATADAFAPVASLATDQPGFVYGASRDLTGFIDGTENPTVEEAPDVALIADGQPGAGGSFAITQRWVHDLAAFHTLSLRDQEGVFGRTKADSIELAPEEKPPTAHIARVVVEGEDGEELQIYRRSVPYGNVTEHGLYFVAFSADPARFDRMLARMFGRSGDGLHDRLTEFSRPVTFSRYFVPSAESFSAVVDGEGGS
jgi:putative iron-dependent peroxidase